MVNTHSGRTTVSLLACMGSVALGAAGATAVRVFADHVHDHADEPLVRTKPNATPLGKIHLYLCAFHNAKMDPKFVVEAHHYCSPAGNGVHQCVVFDSNGPNAKLLGTEYIISNDIYQKLPDGEKKYWHPHAYEILSGQLIAPEAPDMGDALFPGLITTWGKTFHTWPDPGTDVPLGEPLLMWSINADGQIDDRMVARRDAKFGISTEKIRERRSAWGYEVPRVAPPKSINELGRMWADGQSDKPKRK